MYFFIKPKLPTVALVADEFTVAALRPDCRIIELTSSGWRRQLRFSKPDFLFVESAWRGSKNSWKYKIANYNEDSAVSKELVDLIDWFNERSIPTIFWNKEDPIHFNRFQAAASLFDIIYTTDAECIQKYQKINHVRQPFISCLKFAAQPKNTIKIPYKSRKNATVFLGGYYGNEFPERSRIMDELLTGVAKNDLVIYDRFWNGKGKSSFPEKFHPYIRKKKCAKKVNLLYQKYRLYLNVNTVIKSETMFSRRVFELAVNGCCTISSPSKGMSEIFGDLIPVVNNREEAEYQANRFMLDYDLCERVSESLRDIVLSQHTWKHRLNKIYEDVGLNYQ